MSNQENGITPLRVKLRRTYVDKNEIIEKNLQNLQLKSFGKKYAQEKYYNVNVNENNRMPVHARLGKRINIRRGAYQFLNNGFVTKRFALNRKLVRSQGLSSTLQNRLRLRRSGPPRIRQNRRMDYDYTIQIKNNLMQNCKHSCLAQLSLQLQQEIELIQTEANNEKEIIPSLQIHVAGYGSTSIPLNLRFSV